LIDGPGATSETASFVTRGAYTEAEKR
jgi:hypothetical protein